MLSSAVCGRLSLACPRIAFVGRLQFRPLSSSSVEVPSEDTDTRTVKQRLQEVTIGECQGQSQENEISNKKKKADGSH